MKAKYFLLGFLLLTVGAFCATANTQAADYTFENIPHNTPGQKEITVIDEEGLEEVFQPVDLEEGGANWQDNVVGIGMHPYNAPCGMAVYASDNTNVDDLGAKVQSQIDWINESDDFVAYDVEEAEYDDYEVWTVYSDVWGLTDPDNDFNPEPDIEEYGSLFPIDPDDLNVWTWTKEVVVDPADPADDWEEGAVTMWFFASYGHTYNIMPTPTADYLDALEWQDDDFTFEVYYACWSTHPQYVTTDDVWEDFTWDWYVDGLIVTHEASFGYVDEDNDLGVEDYIETWEYSEDRGILIDYKLMDEDENILWEMAAVSAIPGYELPILLGVTAAFVIGIIYVIRKRK